MLCFNLCTYRWIFPNCMQIVCANYETILEWSTSEKWYYFFDFRSFCNWIRYHHTCYFDAQVCCNERVNKLGLQCQKHKRTTEWTTRPAVKLGRLGYWCWVTRPLWGVYRVGECIGLIVWCYWHYGSVWWCSWIMKLGNYHVLQPNFGL